MKFLIFLVLAVVAASAKAPFKIPTENRVRGQYIVVVEKDVGLDFVIDRFRREVTVPFAIKRRFESVLHGFVVKADVDGIALNLLRILPGVRYVEEEEMISVAGSNNNPGSWGIDRIDQADLPIDDKMELNAYGAGTHIYVIDTGINNNHNDFGGRAAIAADMLGGDGFDCNGHGTHCAGTAASNTYGVANEAKVYGIRVLGCDGTGYKSDSIAALNWVATEGMRPAVASMSLGGSRSTAQNDAVADCRAAGVVVVVAAGNEDTNACLKSPASALSAITVASTDSSDKRSWFSNYGACVDLFAPGSSIKSLVHSNNFGTTTMSGTSMATPHVAGIAAVYLSQNYSSEETYSLIINTAIPNKVSDTMGTTNLLAHAD